MKTGSLISSRLRPLSLLCLFGALVVASSAQTITVDNEDAEFSLLSGEWSTGTYGTPWGSYYHWAMTTGVGEASASAEWRPDLPVSGYYYVSVYYVPGTNRAEDAPFTVHHAGGDTLVEINQQINGETWVQLGAFSFNAGTSGSVELSNDAGASVVIADAVRFEAAVTTVELAMLVNPPGWGTTTPAPGGPYAQYLNEVVPISAEAYEGYSFHHWEVTAGAAVTDPSSPDTTVVMDEDKTVRAVFVAGGSPSEEFRGFWADAFHVGFKSTSQIDDMITRALSGNYNAILPEIMAYQDSGSSAHGAYWDSAIVPQATDISGGIDPLAYLVQEAHANGLEVHPWLVTFRASSSWPPSGNTTLANHPEWIMVTEDNIGDGPQPTNGKYELDPGCPGVQEYLLSIVRELVTNYDIDGIHWDYIRYTDSTSGYPAYTWFDDSGLARFKRISGYSGTPSPTYGAWCDFRRREITELIRRVQVEIATNTNNPQQPLRHSAALVTWGNAPSSFESTSSWAVFQNWREWTEQGYLDTAIPMTYYDYDTYPLWYQNWVDASVGWSYDRHCVIGPGVYLNDFEDSLVEIEYTRSAGADGVCTYSYADTNSGSSEWEWYTDWAPEVFDEPAATPEMTWRDPLTTSEGNVYGRVTDGATGEPIDDAEIELDGSAVAYTDGNGFFVITRIGGSTAGVPVAITATYSGYADVTRSAVLVTCAGYTEANLAFGDWRNGDYDVDGDVDGDDFAQFEVYLTGPDQGPPAPGGDLFDFDFDDDIDLHDFRDMQRDTGSSPPRGYGAAR